MTIGHGQTWAVVPLRGLEDAKTRLGGELDAEERLELVVVMATRTLAAARDARGLHGTVLVTADPAAARLAVWFGARTLVQRLPGLNAAIREARAVAVQGGADAVIVLPIDLPAIDAATIDEVLDRAATEHAPGSPGLVAAVPDRHGTGTNVLFLSPPDVIEPAFGEDSLTAHRRAATAAGARFLELGGPLVADVDTGADLMAAEAASSDPSVAGAGLGHGGPDAS